ncbi:single-stranded DNA-binding protein [Candidatus Saccharibacteria bacterium QS_5_54_17]|nr:MAG: single-stranded DNA-binding protein [Candidatus Saccharibacteria bacterium QS_5_54_17]
MARSFNQAIVVGNLARDPELRTTQNGRSVTSFAVATNRVWQDQNGETQEQADFHNVVAWAKLAELADQYLSKGRRVMVVGRLQTRSWEDQDGKKNYRTEIVANELNFMDGPGGSSSGSDEASQEKTGDDSDQSDKQSESDVQIEDLDDDVDLNEVPF